MASLPVRDPVGDHVLTPQNSALVVIDYQPSQFAGVRSIDRDLLLENIVSTVKTAKAFDMPIVHSTINVATGSHAPLVRGLFSALDSGGSALGVGGLSLQRGKLLAIMGLYPQLLAGATCDGQPSDCPQVLRVAHAQAGQLLKVSASGGGQAKAGVGGFDFQWTVDNHSTYGGELDANPYGLVARPGGTYVADAGSNTLDWVANDGQISVLHRFADPSEDPEPLPIARPPHHDACASVETPIAPAMCAA